MEALCERLEGVRAGLQDRQREADEQVARHFHGLVGSDGRQRYGPKDVDEPQEDAIEPHE